MSLLIFQLFDFPVHVFNEILNNLDALDDFVFENPHFILNCFTIMVDASPLVVAALSGGEHAIVGD